MTISEPRLRRCLSVVLAVAACLSLMAVPRVASAETLPNITTLRGTVTLYQIGKGAEAIEEFSYRGGSLKNIKSTNKSVAILEKSPCDESKTACLLAHKAGTAKISYTFKGKKYSAKVVVRPYSNPIKKMVVGGKDYASLFTRRSSVTSSAFSKFRSKKITITPAKGWKVKQILAPNAGGKLVEVKNGAFLPKMNETALFRVVLINTKTGGIQRMAVSRY